MPVKNPYVPLLVWLTFSFILLCRQGEDKEKKAEREKRDQGQTQQQSSCCFPFLSIINTQIRVFDGGGDSDNNGTCVYWHVCYLLFVPWEGRWWKVEKWQIIMTNDCVCSKVVVMVMMTITQGNDDKEEVKKTVFMVGFGFTFLSSDF